MWNRAIGHPRRPRRNITAIPTTIVMVMATPENIRPAKPASRPHQSRRSMGTIVIGEQQLREAEHECTDERDLKRHQDVLSPRAEEHEHRRDDRRDPRANPGAAHDHPQQRDGDQVEQDHQHLVRHVAVHTLELPHEPVREDRQRRPVLKVPAKQIPDVSGGTRRQEIPIVSGEPRAVSEEQQHRERDHLERGECDQRAAAPNAVSPPRHAGLLAGARRTAPAQRRLGVNQRPPTSKAAPDPSVSHNGRKRRTR